MAKKSAGICCNKIYCPQKSRLRLAAFNDSERRISKSKNNNHFVSRFQLRRFLCDPPKNKPGRYFVWVYSLDQDPAQINIQHVGSAVKFYGESDDELENAFARRESNYGTVFSIIEKSPEKIPMYSDQLSDLCWLFSFRTRALREKVKLSFAETLNRVAASATMERVAERFSSQLDARLLKRIEDRMVGHTRTQRATLRRQPEFQRALFVAKQQAREFVRSDQFTLQFREHVSRLSSIASETSVLASEHNRILQEMIDLGERCPEKLRPKRWCPMISEAGSFVLGDSGAALATNEGKFSPFIGMGSTADCLFLPINPWLTAVGLYNETERSWTEEDVINATTSSSFENFFAPRKDERLDEFAKKCLPRNGIVTDAEIDEIVNSFWAQ